MKRSLESTTFEDAQEFYVSLLKRFLDIGFVSYLHLPSCMTQANIETDLFMIFSSSPYCKAPPVFVGIVHRRGRLTRRARLSPS